MVNESREPAASVSGAQGENEPGKNSQDCKIEGKKPVCGLVMPISAIDDCSESHWKDVKKILLDAISAEGFECKLVSEDDSVGIIQDRIVKNLYNSDMVVCDVSHKNPNVMFELGMRLAFDKPVVVVKDDLTNYSFDTSPVEHVGYPRDLRYPSIIEFKDELRRKLVSTYIASKAEDYSPFLVNFGQFHVAKIENKEVPIKDYLENMFSNFKLEISVLHKYIKNIDHGLYALGNYVGKNIPLGDCNDSIEREYASKAEIRKKGLYFKDNQHVEKKLF